MYPTFDSLSSEILVRIIRNLLTYGEHPYYLRNDWRKPIPTALLLINKRFCRLSMAEQVRDLNFCTNSSLKKWLNIVDDTYQTNTNNSYFPSRLAYGDFLNMVQNLQICWNKYIKTDDDPDLDRFDLEDLCARIAQFVRRCPSLIRVCLLNNEGGYHKTLCLPILLSLPATTQNIEVDFEYLSISTIKTFIYSCLPKLPELRIIKLFVRSHTADVAGLHWHERDIRDLLERAPRLYELELSVVDLMQHFSNDVLDATMQLCPDLYEIGFHLATNLSNEKIAEFLLVRGHSTRSLWLSHRVVTDDYLQLIATFCPNLKNLILWNTEGFGAFGVRAVLNHCPQLELLQVPNDLGLKEDPVWRIFKLHRQGTYTDREQIDLYDDKITYQIMSIEGENVQVLKHVLNDIIRVFE